MSILNRCVSLAIVGVLLIGSAIGLESNAWGDRLNFYDGHMEDRVRITEIAGDLIRYKSGFMHEYATRRMRLSDRQDRITTWEGVTYVGEIHYIDGKRIEIITDTGRHTFWKATINSIELGSRLVPYPQNRATSNPVASPSSASYSGPQWTTPEPVAPASTSMMSPARAMDNDMQGPDWDPQWGPSGASQDNVGPDGIAPGRNTDDMPSSYNNPYVSPSNSRIEMDDSQSSSSYVAPSRTSSARTTYTSSHSSSNSRKPTVNFPE